MIFLARLGHLDLLQQLGQTVWAPTRVYQEVVIDAPEAPGAKQVKAAASWLRRETPQGDLERFNLDDGEAEVLALTMGLSDAVAILDEFRARRVAENLHVPHTGTLGLLVQAKIQGLIRDLKPLIVELKGYGYWISDDLLNTALEQAGEPGVLRKP